VQEKPVWEKTFEFLGEVVRSLPVFREFREISASFVDGYLGKTRFGEKPFCCEENPWFFREKTSLWRLVCFLFGACPGGWPLLVLRKNPFWGKNLCEENPWFFREKTSLWRLVCFLSGASPGCWPLLRLQCAVVSGRKKTF